MTILVYAVILLLILLLIKEAVPKLYSLIAIIFFFILLHFLLSKSVLPLIGQILSYVNSVPYVSQLVYSALFYQMGVFFKMLFVEQEQETMGEFVMFSVRIVLLTYWVGELAKVLSSFSSILEKLQ
ncbi:hypothetical protein NST62_05565 [Ureibacillus sp. FSL K6-8385]|uniref:Stage III sporulation protein AD n=1 Tax=Ureibacillus terrenus TaxID=118246 RepID=A0A540V7X5_9BACL|nr:hypothetical protein [Ureibacillus terrenus]MED3660757.1 hypothetical protein [Ureibacillus terrenus]MED3762945.1 hypothetical protein [Ureibacillus terrenus]TQE92253.1 hypothetical protein FKZ59_00675 [Ureibacillus terrenus]